MTYTIIFFVVIFLMYKLTYKKESYTSVKSFYKDKSDDPWKKINNDKKKSLESLKNCFKNPKDANEALHAIENAVNNFIKNHGKDIRNIITKFNNIKKPLDIKKKEVLIRKELDKFYRDRSNLDSKILAVYLAFKHSKIILKNTEVNWKYFTGLHKLQSILKSEEYFEDLLKLMICYKNTYQKHPLAEKLTKDINRFFELWNSRNLAEKEYREARRTINGKKNPSEKHFAIQGIINYLKRRFQFNPRYRDELIYWCKEDVKIYKEFLIDFHESDIFTIDEMIYFDDNPELKKKALSDITFEKVRDLKDYNVPSLTSYLILEHIYSSEKDYENLSWIQNIGIDIGYITKNETIKAKKVTVNEKVNFDKITKTIEVKSSGKKGKLAFVDSKGIECSSEGAFRDYMENMGWKVMRAEVSFWQAMFCLSFWEEIFKDMNPIMGNDIPSDLFQGNLFYLNRSMELDSKFNSILAKNIPLFINSQLENSKKHWTGLLYNGNQDISTYLKTSIVQEFLNEINPKIFAKIVYRIAKNPNENRSGVSDFVVWNEQKLKFIEVKKIKETIRESQKKWISWMDQENIENEIIRVKSKKS